MSAVGHIRAMLCTNCGTPRPSGASSCRVCGAPVGALAAEPLEPVRGPTVQIRLWHGYIKAEFFIELDEFGPDNVRIERSRAFTWIRRRDEPPPDREEIWTAYTELVARLEALGWEQVGTRTPWYAQSFRRRDGRMGDLSPSGS